MRHDLRIVCLLLLAAPLVAAQETRFDWDGHVKGRVIAEWFPDGSLFRDLAGSSIADVESDLRLNLRVDRGRWSFNSDYQAYVAMGDGVELIQDLALPPGLDPVRFPDDERRLFDLTHVISQRNDAVLLHRLDRISLGYTSERAVIRAGRQAITWGDGLFFSPFDIVNPFDPAQIDTEYKAGDDMLYVQYLRGNGDDLQFAWVARRDPLTGDVASEEATVTIKYHGISGASEYDVLLAHNYDRPTIGLGGNRSIGGAVVRGDLLIADADDWTVELVVNLSYSWMWAGKNVTGAVEYYFNGYGQENGRYDPASLATNPELVQRLARGETFSLGRNYLAAGGTIELSPLLTLSPSVFANLGDPSALLQFVANYSLGDNLTFWGAVNVPVGPDGSEYGGIETGLPDRYLSRTAGLFVQLAWYFQ